MVNLVDLRALPVIAWAKEASRLSAVGAICLVLGASIGISTVFQYNFGAGMVVALLPLGFGLMLGFLFSWITNAHNWAWLLRRMQKNVGLIRLIATGGSAKLHMVNLDAPAALVGDETYNFGSKVRPTFEKDVPVFSYVKGCSSPIDLSPEGIPGVKQDASAIGGIVMRVRTLEQTKARLAAMLAGNNAWILLGLGIVLVLGFSYFIYDTANVARINSQAALEVGLKILNRTGG